MKKRMIRTQARDKPTTSDVVGKKRTHKVNKIYFLPLIMAIIFTFGCICVYADEYVLINTQTINTLDDTSLYIPVTENVATVTFSDNTSTGYIVTINNKNLPENGFLFLAGSASAYSNQTIYYVNAPYDPDTQYIYADKVTFATRAWSAKQWRISSELYTANTALYEYYDITVTLLEGGTTNKIDTPFTISQFTKGEEQMNVIETILAVFSAIGDWFVEIIPSMLGIFYNSETGITVLGALAVASLAIAVILLVLAWIVDFFKFRR